MMKKTNTKISTSILAADFCNIRSLVAELEAAKTDLIHLDVMDGHFVPNISFGTKMVEDIRKITDLPLDVHLMITDPKKYIDNFAQAGSDIITVHFEATDDLARDLRHIKSHNILAGVSIKPNTPVAVLEPYLEFIDLILIMSVEPGFGGQRFMTAAIEKVREARALADRSGKEIIIEIDGGITDENARTVVEAGCDMLVAGSFITNAKNKLTAISSLK